MNGLGREMHNELVSRGYSLLRVRKHATYERGTSRVTIPVSPSDSRRGLLNLRKMLDRIDRGAKG